MASGIISGTAEHGVCTRLTARVFSRTAEHGVFTRSGAGPPSKATTAAASAGATGKHDYFIAISSPDLVQNLWVLFCEFFQVDCQVIDFDAAHLTYLKLYGQPKSLVSHRVPHPLSEGLPITIGPGGHLR